MAGHWKLFQHKGERRDQQLHSGEGCGDGVGFPNLLFQTTCAAHWIAADKAKTKEADREFIKYVSLYTLLNAGVNAQYMNTASAGLSKMLNTAARWAPKIVNPVDVNGKGILYKFDIRDYWGYSLIDTSAQDFALFPGLSDDDMAFAPKKVDINGNVVKYASEAGQIHKLKPAVTRDDKFARLAWARILKGNAEAATLTTNLTRPTSMRSSERGKWADTLTPSGCL